MALHDRVRELRDRTGGPPAQYQGVTKDRVRAVLAYLDLGTNNDLIDNVFALLDDQTDSWFAKPPLGAKIADGATTAHLACHVGILQRDGGKLDREGRDYWIKPLRDLGGIDPITLVDSEFIAGHVKAKSPNSCYRLHEGLVAILKAPEGEWRGMLEDWASQDIQRERKAFQARMAEEARRKVDTGHAQLIRASVEHYVPRFLPGFQVLYIDDSDGDRISDEERARMARAGITLTLEDAMPDVLLWNPDTDMLWVIEAVTSDGEVDQHKVNQVQRLRHRCGKAGVGFTTTYRTWKEAALRQGTHKNLAVDTYLWVQEDPAKQFKAEA
ncbi:MAG: BsuBI/PstI family type II restriction endonuclease [Alphaproteobacteria bacterium]